MHGFTRPDEGIEPLDKTPVTFQLWTPDGSHMLELDEWPMRRIKRGESVRDLELRIRRPESAGPTRAGKRSSPTRVPWSKPPVASA